LFLNQSEARKDMLREQLDDAESVNALCQAFSKNMVGPDKIRAYRDSTYSLPYRVGGRYETLGAGDTLVEAIANALKCLEEKESGEAQVQG
jgi:hypothetical protein